MLDIIYNTKSYLAAKVGCNTMVFMMRGIKSATTLWTFCLYNCILNKKKPLNSQIMKASEHTNSRYCRPDQFKFRLYTNTKTQDQREQKNRNTNPQICYLVQYLVQVYRFNNPHYICHTHVKLFIPCTNTLRLYSTI